MPSLFSRSRTTSTPDKQLSLPIPSSQGLYANQLDEFGRVSSRASGKAATSKKEKKKAKDEKRARTISSSREQIEQPEFTLPDGSFLPLNLEKPRQSETQQQGFEYGYLSYERHVVLGIEQVARLVDVLCTELTSRGGLTTPFIFSSLALDISSATIRKLIQAFLGTCTINIGTSADQAEAQWREEARFAGLHELGMTLRWGLAKVVRSVGGQDVRGLLNWEIYAEFRDSEAALNYPPTHFSTLLNVLSPPLRSIIIQILSLLSRLTANSATSGHTPPSLSSLFGPLLFGLGPATLSFHQTYASYLRSVNATEHILLAFIRWQDVPSSANADSGSAATLGVPARLKDWIRGYPSMLPDRQQNEKPQARRGARIIRVVSVKRNVRMYSPDLVKTAASWANKHKRDGVATMSGRALTGSKEWDRIAPAAYQLQPRYSENYKKKMDMPPSFHPDSGIAPSISAASSYASTKSSFLGEDLLSSREGEDRFRSLTDLKWGEFETMGFGGLGIDDTTNNKLKFDLTESARTARTAKRATLSWNDFSDAGFSRMDEPLKATLEFSTPVANTITSWPAQNAEMTRKLKKTQKALPAFGWDVEPVLGGEEVIEEAFIDVFCDLIYGGGWLDMERDEAQDRDCNWALIEFKSIPANRTTAGSLGSDPRTSTSVLLFEEFVPLEYRQQLSLPPRSRRRLPSLFSPKSKQWKPAATLNGRPYVVGHVPNSPSYREAEFEGMLRGSTETKVLSYGSANANTRSATIPSMVTSTTPTPSSPMLRITSPPYTGSRSDSPALETPSKKGSTSRFKISSIPSPSIRRSGMPPAEYSTVDFETRLASYSDDENDGRRRLSRDDSWVDILVGSHSRRLNGQDASPGLGRRSDPELASQEVAQALAAIRGQAPSPDSEGDMEPVYGREDTVVIDEVERIPRSRRSESTDSDRLAYDEPDRSQEDDEDGYDSDPNSTLAKLRQAREQRMKMGGYFDMHPERRHARDDEDFRPSPSDLDSEGEAYASPKDATYPERKPIRALPQPPVIRPASPSLPQFDEAEQQRARREQERAKYDSGIFPKQEPFPTDTPETPKKPLDGGNGGGKTAALIAMYRERENASSPSGAHPPLQAPQPSRLPVRNGLPPTPAPQASKPADPIEPILEPPPPIIEMGGRASPGRYVHGAPLHNVMEEEEEEV